VSYRIDPAALGLRAGKHVITLSSLLLTEKAVFNTR
jgi:hypothetical protein